MRNLNLQNPVLIPLLVCGLVASVACSSGSDTPATTGPAAGPTSGTGGATSGTGTGAGGAPSTTSSTTNPATTTSGGGGSTGGTGSGTGGAGGSAGPSVCDGKGTRILTLADNKVDDFEGAMLLPGWSSFNDTMPTNNFKLMQAPGGAAGTANGGHYAGMGAKTTTMMGFGVGMIFNTAIDPMIGQYCIDISAFDGVAFWAKAAVDMSKVGVNFVVPATNPKPDPAHPELGGGDCVMPGCYNHPAKTITLGTTWKQYSVPFADAVGGGAGARVRNVIQMLGWLSPDATWDFWVDEIQFYKGTASTGPIGGGDAGP
jgi:hypothetical protein